MVTPQGFRRWVNPRLGLILLVALAWGHTVRFDFVWDDTYFIEELSSIRSLRHVPEMFTSLEAQSSYPEGFVLFRPLRTVHYAVLTWLGGGPPPRPWMFHMANVLWHGAVVLLFHAVLLRLLSGWKGGSIAEPIAARLPWIAGGFAAAFAVHPVVSETVCWAKSLDDLMASAFTLAATLELLRWETGSKRYGKALFYFALACYSKVSALPFVAVAFLILLILRRKPLGQAARATAGFAAVAGVFMAHRHWVIGRTSQAEPISGSYGQTLIDMLPVVTQYLRLLAGVPPFSADYSYMQGGHSIGSAAVVIGLALLIVAAGVCVWLLRNPSRSVEGLGVAWVGLFLLPVANLIPSMQYMAERFLYLPLIGAMMTLSALWVGLCRWRGSVGFLAGIVVVWGVLAWQRSWAWQDEVTLFVRTSLDNPYSARVENNTVAAVFKLPHMAGVYRVARVPGGGQTTVLAQDETSLRQADWPRIQQTLEQLHHLFPTNAVVANNLGFAHVRQGDLAGAIPFFELAATRVPSNPSYWGNLGRALSDLGQAEKSIAALNRALALNSEYVPALDALSAVYWRKSDFASALGVLLRLQQLEPANPNHGRWIEEARQKLAAPAPNP